VPGILNLLGEHLYSEPRVVLRELIQNAHDSCQRRLVEDSHLPEHYQPRIDITIDAQLRRLTIRDNGSGLTEQEIHDFLSTIGQGYTSELRERMQFADRDEVLLLIGQFGLGMLSAFLVADYVEMHTLSFQAGSPAWCWASAGEGHYALVPSECSGPGSTLMLSLKLAGEFLLNESIVRDAIRTYADFLHIPIYLNDSDNPINAGDAPWHLAGADIQDYRRFIVEHYGGHEPLAVIPLHDHVETVSHASYGHDAVTTPLKGVLFIPARSSASARDYGGVAVYIRRMHVTDEEGELLPHWAGFVRGVVDCPGLKPTANREQVRRDESFYHVQKLLGEQLTDYLADLASRQPAVWRDIVIAHNDVLKAQAPEDPQLFAAVCDLVTFESSREPLTLRHCLETGGGDIYYLAEERGALQEKMLSEARGLTVIDASRPGEEAFLKTYAATHPDVKLHRLEPGASFVFAEVGDLDRHWELLVSYYSEQGIPVKVVKFEPASVPALLVYPAGSERFAQAQAALESGEIGGAVANLVDAYLQMNTSSLKGIQGILHLNAGNSLLLRLLRLLPEQTAATAALEIIYHNARLFAGQTLRSQGARQGFDMIGYSLEQVIGALEEAMRGSGAGSSS